MSHGIDIRQLPDHFSGNELRKEAQELLTCILRRMQETAEDELYFCLMYVPEARTTDLYFMSAWEVDSYYRSGGIWDYEAVTPGRVRLLEDLARGAPISPRE